MEVVKDRIIPWHTSKKEKKNIRSTIVLLPLFVDVFIVLNFLSAVSAVLSGSDRGSGKCQRALQQQAAIWQPSELAATPPAAVAKRPYKAGHASSF